MCISFLKCFVLKRRKMFARCELHALLCLKRYGMWHVAHTSELALECTELGRLCCNCGWMEEFV